MNYKALDDQVLQNLAQDRFGNVLKPLSEIGREAIIKELQAYDRFQRLKEGDGDVSQKIYYFCMS